MVGKEDVERLKETTKEFLRKEQDPFEIGSIVEWKDCCCNKAFPGYNFPMMVMKVYEEPIRNSDIVNDIFYCDMPDMEVAFMGFMGQAGQEKPLPNLMMLPIDSRRVKHSSYLTKVSLATLGKEIKA